MTDLAQNMTKHATRSAWIEWVRVLSIAGIVWFHSEVPYRTFGLGGLIAFTIMGCAFIKPVGSVPELRKAMWIRAQRLLWPWIWWSIIYGALRSVEAVRQHEPAMAWWDGRMIWYGTWIHLWFLPFLFMVTVLVQIVGLVGERMRIPLFALIAWTLIAATPGWVWLQQWGVGTPFRQWISVLPAVGLGMLMCGMTPGTSAARRRIVWLLIIDAMAIGATYIIMPDRAGSLTKHIVGAMALLAWAPTAVVSRAAITLGALSMGVYLVHPLLFVAGQRLLNISDSSVYTVLGVIVASFVASAGIALVNQQLRQSLLPMMTTLKAMAPRRRVHEA